MIVRQAKPNDYKRLISSLRFVFKSNSYINKDYLKQDLQNGTCYVLENNNKIVAIASLVYDNNYKVHYIKRLSVPNKRQRSKGYAKEMIKFLPFIDFRISSKLISKPAIITNRKTPNSEITRSSSPL